ncbi:tetratricopeptide repeat protein [Hamadaea tsunoensis]|uniref:Replicase polyprotein 1ab n=1 Tax=Hamadaea tsunoensis TaxID=53368 RepID=UPI001FE048A2|nr:Replicase polyprotein 1ab [Hamadaea tsunoensis]
MARHLVATGYLIDDDAELALEHAVAARRLASRIASVREAVGLAAYRAGEWQTAISELRTYQRLTGRQTHLAVLADCERALGRPEKAVDMFRAADRAKQTTQEAIELLIVAAGARGDLGQKDAAVAMLQVRELTTDVTEPWVARLRYAYADALLDAGRADEAREWFSRAAEVDDEGLTDAAERLLELDGVNIEGDEDDEDEEGVSGDAVEGDRDASGEGAGEDGEDADDEDDYDDEDADEDDEDYDADVDDEDDEDGDEDYEDDEDGEDEDGGPDVEDDEDDEEDGDEEDDDEDSDAYDGEDETAYENGLPLDDAADTDEFDDETDADSVPEPGRLVSGNPTGGPAAEDGDGRAA